MIVRALDTDDDWTFGKGRNNYLKNRDAVKQNIKTRLYQFLGDCFFAVSEGIDWFNLLGGKDQLELELAIRATILNTEGVTGLEAIGSVFDAETRAFSVQFVVQTVYGLVADDFSLDQAV